MQIPPPTEDRSVYRRSVRMRARPGRAFAEIEDNAHHFQVRLEHDGERVTRIEGAAPRYPWTSCPGAAVPLRRLEGMALAERCSSIGAAADASTQCTHLFDAAGLAVAQAWAHVHDGRARRDYGCEVRTDPDFGGSRAALSRDGEPVLAWRVEEGTIREPAPFAGRPFQPGFTRWVDERFDPQEAEAALVLRRACFVAPSRYFDWQGVSRATELADMLGVCHTFRPGTVESALRVRGSVRPFDEQTRMLDGAEPTDW